VLVLGNLRLGVQGVAREKVRGRVVVVEGEEDAPGGDDGRDGRLDLD
jgi:hypothetical protein